MLPDDGYDVTPFADGTVRVTPHEGTVLVVRLDTTSTLVDPTHVEADLHIAAFPAPDLPLRLPTASACYRPVSVVITTLTAP